MDKGLIMKTEWNSLQGFMADNFTPFQPYAIYDKHMDCIRVKILDCSVTEKRMSRYFTLLEANHSPVQKHVGFTIKGIAYLFDKLGLQQKGVYEITQILDEIVRVFPDSVVKKVSEEFSGKVTKLRVSFDDPPNDSLKQAA